MDDGNEDVEVAVRELLGRLASGVLGAKGTTVVVAVAVANDDVDVADGIVAAVDVAVSYLLPGNSTEYDGGGSKSS